MTIRNAISSRAPVLTAAIVATSLIFMGAVAADETPDCADELQQIPRDGSTVSVDDLWLTYSGAIVYGGVANPDDDIVELSGPTEEFELEDADAASHVGLRIDGALAGDYEWSMGRAPTASFTVSSPAADDEKPTMGDGEVETDLELLVYEDFPVMFRQWELSFPAGSDDQAGAENLRYLVTFSWEQAGEQESEAILVTPKADEATGEQISITLGGRTDRCRHSEPSLPLTSEAEIEVRVVDLGGKVSENAAKGTFEGVEAEKLADAHEEFNEVIRGLDTDEDGMTTEEAVQEMEADGEEETEDEEASNGCSTVGGKNGGLALILMVLGLAVVRWARQ